MKKHDRDYSGDGKEAWEQLESIISCGYSSGNVFNDWLDLSLNSLLSMTENIGKPDFVKRLKSNKLTGKYEDRYMEIVKRYEKQAPVGKRPIDYMANATKLLFAETWKKEKDILGEIYQKQITLGEHGQFFTPEHITGFMTKMFRPKKDEKVCDPCCGSGRFLISSGKLNPDGCFMGIDTDRRCAIMATLNMWMFDFNATIIWGDSLAMKYFRQWEIKKGGYVWEVEIEQKPIQEVGQATLF